MPWLKHCVKKAFSEALLEIYSPVGAEQFPSHACQILARLFEADTYSYSEQASSSRNDRFEVFPIYPDPAGYEAFGRLMYQHPLVRESDARQLRTPVTISDFVPLYKWRRTELFNEVFRLRHLNYQLAFFGATRSPMLVLTVNRQRRDFNEEERTLLQTLSPHFEQAFNLQRVASWQARADALAGRGLLVLDRKGNIRFQSPHALRVLWSYFPCERSVCPDLPEPIWRWAERMRTALVTEAGLRRPLLPLIVERGSKRLTVRLAFACEGAESLILLDERNVETSPEPLRALGLTRREAEVLFWVSQGKRNGEIASILEARSRTIGKHVERILGKLCVETRTAAANIAAEVLHSC